MKLSLPLTITLPRKTKADKVIPMNMNIFRNLNFYDSNTAKRQWKLIVEKAVDAASPFLPPSPPFAFRYTVFPGTGRSFDVMNVCAAIDKFTADALQEIGLILNDNYRIIPEIRCQFGTIDKENPRVELEINEATK